MLQYKKVATHGSPQFLPGNLTYGGRFASAPYRFLLNRTITRFFLQSVEVVI